jgi:hypothetical protein
VDLEERQNTLLKETFKFLNGRAPEIDHLAHHSHKTFRVFGPHKPPHFPAIFDDCRKIDALHCRAASRIPELYFSLIYYDLLVISLFLPPPFQNGSSLSNYGNYFSCEYLLLIPKIEYIPIMASVFPSGESSILLIGLPVFTCFSFAGSSPIAYLTLIR